MDSTRLPKSVMSERRVGIIGACLAMIGPFSMAVYTPAMPEIVEAFGSTEEAVKMSLAMYFAGFAMAQLVTGPLSDGLGRRPITIVFMGIYTAASLLAVFAPNVTVLILARFIQGIGAAAGIAMSRAIVRDLFNHDHAARIMNLIGTILAVGPATAPLIGGLTMEFFGWHAIFIVMALVGIALVLITIFAIRETVERDVSRIKPRALIQSYLSLLRSPWFMSASMTNAGSTGALYAFATMLPFVMMDRVGLTPTEFGLAMLMQSLSYFTGTLTMRALMRRWTAKQVVPIGLAAIGAGTLALGIGLRLFEPSFLIVMVPVGFYAFGVAFTSAAMTMAAMEPFGKNAGAASSLVGFLQLATGLAGGSLAALIGDATDALATVVLLLGTLSILSWIVWKRVPYPG
ncbi:MAG: multidrug effflux MFS transporter [Rhizobiaceae bacterium]|nr:multidrug effflux MFS transporter [Rhizobiaceae bacterium]